MTADTATAPTPADLAAAARLRRADDDDMQVRNDSNPTSVASAISHAVYDGKPVRLRAIGAGALNQAVKAVAIARGFVAPRGFDIAVVPGFTQVTGSQGDELSAIVLRVVQINS